MFFFVSEWVLGNREDLAKDIIAELEPQSSEVMTANLYQKYS